MPSNIKPTVEIRWSAGDSVLLKNTNNRTFPILGMLGNAKAVPIGQVWVSMPEDATHDIEGNANVYLAGELINVDADSPNYLRAVSARSNKATETARPMDGTRRQNPPASPA